MHTVIFHSSLSVNIAHLWNYKVVLCKAHSCWIALWMCGYSECRVVGPTDRIFFKFFFFFNQLCMCGKVCANSSVFFTYVNKTHCLLTACYVLACISLSLSLSAVTLHAADMLRLLMRCNAIIAAMSWDAGIHAATAKSPLATGAAASLIAEDSVIANLKCIAFKVINLVQDYCV